MHRPHAQAQKPNPAFQCWDQGMIASVTGDGACDCGIDARRIARRRQPPENDADQPRMCSDRIVVQNASHCDPERCNHQRHPQRKKYSMPGSPSTHCCESTGCQNETCKRIVHCQIPTQQHLSPPTSRNSIFPMFSCMHDNVNKCGLVSYSRKMSSNN